MQRCPSCIYQDCEVFLKKERLQGKIEMYELIGNLIDDYDDYQQFIWEFEKLQISVE